MFRRFHDSPVPTFAFVNGAAMGGGLELGAALPLPHAGQEGRRRSRCPRCFLGLVPGWGGTQLLPNLIGPEAAVKVIIENALNQNRMLDRPEAVELGIVDALLDAADFLEQSLRWAAGVLNGDDHGRPRPDHSGDDWDGAVATRPGLRRRQGRTARRRRRTGRST